MSLRRHIALAEKLGTPDQIADLKAAAEALENSIDWGGGSGEGVMMEFLQDEEPVDENGDPLEEADFSTPGFKEWFDDWAQTRIWDAWGNLHGTLHKQGGVFRLYRCITAPKDFKLDPSRHPGIYWSWSEGAAEAHWGKYDQGDIEWVIAADVPEGSVNWIQTLAQNASPDYENECEITLKQNAALEIVSCRPRKA